MSVAGNTNFSWFCGRWFTRCTVSAVSVGTAPHTPEPLACRLAPLDGEPARLGARPAVLGAWVLPQAATAAAVATAARPARAVPAVRAGREAGSGRAVRAVSRSAVR